MVRLVMHSDKMVRRMSAKLSSLPAIQWLMNVRLIPCILILSLYSCSNSNKTITACEQELDSLELILTANPNYAANNPAEFMSLRHEITQKLTALEQDKTLSAREVSHIELLTLRSSLLFTGALEAALKSTRAQADSLNTLKLKQAAE